MRQLRGPGELRQRDAGVGGFADDTNVDCEGGGGPRVPDVIPSLVQA